jgi:hypothetical protein
MHGSAAPFSHLLDVRSLPPRVDYCSLFALLAPNLCIDLPVGP